MQMQCAVKKISKEKLRENPVYEELMQDELLTLKNIDEPNIMRVHELLQDTTDIYIVTEFIKGGELLNRLIECQTFTEQRAAYIMFQLLRGLNYLHTSKKVVHRDLKLENILLVSQDRGNLEIKIADFGFAKKLDNEEREYLQCGTPLYMAPEVFDPKNNNGYRFEVDIWSAGVVAYILLMGRAPFDGKNRN
jgi:calcium-dependent protein kinase